MAFQFTETTKSYLLYYIAWAGEQKIKIYMTRWRNLKVGDTLKFIFSGKQTRIQNMGRNNKGYPVYSLLTSPDSNDLHVAPADDPVHETLDQWKFEARQRGLNCAVAQDAKGQFHPFFYTYPEEISQMEAKHREIRFVWQSDMQYEELLFQA